VAVAIKRGFAWIASTYRREGWGLRLDAEDSDDARKFFGGGGKAWQLFGSAQATNV
jgi:hypothetical protein